MVFRLSVLFLLFLVGGCAAANSPQHPDAQDHYDYELRILEYYGAYGIGFEYLVSPSAIVMLTRNDFGYKNKELANVSLSESERKILFDIIHAVPLADLDSKYSTNMFDGRDLLFEFNVPGMPEREILVSNYRQKDLLGVLDAVQNILDRKHPRQTKSAAPAEAKS